ncbi:MAG: hypothetical protein C4337_03890, partial [Armatimonadota bacterium]
MSVVLSLFLPSEPSSMWGLFAFNRRGVPVRIECPYRDFVRAWLREPSWESLRDGYVLPHRELLEAYNRSWGWGGDVEEDYRRRWGARPAEAGALVARLGQSGLPARLRSAAATA